MSADDVVTGALGLGFGALVGLIGTGVALGVSQLPGGAPGQGPLQQYLAKQLVAWQPSAWAPLDFCIQDTRASYDNPHQAQNTLPVLQAELDFLLSLDPTSVRVDVGYDAFAENETTTMANVTAVIDAIKSAGKQLVIADAAREAYRKSPVPWTQFQSDWVARVSDLAGRFQPDAYVVIKEPGWYVPMISDIRTNLDAQSPSNWVSLLGGLASAVKSASPSTLAGISLTGLSVDPAGSRDYAFFSSIAQGAEGLANVDILGFDCYGPNDFAGAQSFLASSPTAKRAWLTETWSSTSPSAGGGVQETIDEEWVQVAYDFCLLEGLSMMNPFFSDELCSYSLAGETDPATIVSTYQTSTLPSYGTYQALIQGRIPIQPGIVP